MIPCHHFMQCVKLFDIIPLSGKDPPLGTGHPISRIGEGSRTGIYVIIVYRKIKFEDLGTLLNFWID
jgi:hypothetical protein